MNTLPIYDGTCIKTEIRTYGDKVYTNFRSLNVPEDGRMKKIFSHFYWFFTYLWKQILAASMFRQMCL